MFLILKIFLNATPKGSISPKFGLIFLFFHVRLDQKSQTEIKNYCRGRVKSCFYTLYKIGWKTLPHAGNWTRVSRVTVCNDLHYTTGEHKAEVAITSCQWSLHANLSLRYSEYSTVTFYFARHYSCMLYYIAANISVISGDLLLQYLFNKNQWLYTKAMVGTVTPRSSCHFINLEIEFKKWIWGCSYFSCNSTV